MSLMFAPLLLLAVLSAIGALVCWVMAMVRFFQRDNILAGLVTFFFPFIGWIIAVVKSNEYQMTKLTVWWAVFSILPLITAFVVFAGMTLGSGEPTSIDLTHSR